MNSAILIVEDEEDDVLFLTSAFKKAGVASPIHVARHGQEALDYFQGAGLFADREAYPIPYLVLLDLKLPYVMGLDVLRWIRSRSEFDSTIVIPLTSSQHHEDIAAAYSAGANAYLVKPNGYEDLQVLVRAIRDFWLTANQAFPGSVAVADGVAA